MHLRKRTAAFTLLELLVVVAIIAVLIGILVPTLSNAQITSRRTACQATLKGIGAGFQEYIQQNDWLMPDGAIVPSLDGAPPRPPGHMPLPLGLAAEVTSPNAWRCSADNKGYISWATGQFYPSYFAGEGISFAYNARMGGQKIEKTRMFQNFGYQAVPEMYVLYDFDNFHGPAGDPKAKNVLYADWHVGTVKDIFDAAGIIPSSPTQPATQPY